jgi:hypothetical protein
MRKNFLIKNYAINKNCKRDQRGREARTEIENIFNVFHKYFP